jgi:hypothetical protein
MYHLVEWLCLTAKKFLFNNVVCPDVVFYLTRKSMEILYKCKNLFVVVVINNYIDVSNYATAISFVFVKYI